MRISNVRGDGESQPFESESRIRGMLDRLVFAREVWTERALTAATGPMRSYGETG
jgi:hypothetical protein